MITPVASLRTLWLRGLTLAWPVILENVLRTLMRTTDVIVAGLFSPAAVAAVGLADVYARILNRVGFGIGDATIALSSQDTGSGATTNRNEAVTQAAILGGLVGLPFTVFGLFFSDTAIAILGANSEVVSMGGQYLSIVMIVAPAIHIKFVGAKAIQGIGDTRTPMYINIAANGINIGATVVLALGLGGVPKFSVIGIALGTAIGETFAAVLFLAAIYGPGNDLLFVWPSDWTITNQLIRISTPRFAEGMSEMIAEFPLNGILLVFGTEANAAYHIGRRLYQQVISPLARGFATAANILVGQSLGQSEPRNAYVNGGATTALGVCAVAPLSLVMFVGAETFVRIFTNDPATIGYAVGFGHTFAVATVFIVAFEVFAGSLRGGSETRSPLLATVGGTLVFLLGVSYVGGIVFGYGISAVYVAIVVDYAWRASFVGSVFYRRNWIAFGAALIAERGSDTGTVSDKH